MGARVRAAAGTLSRAAALLAAMTVLLGGAYPLAVTGIARLVAPDAATGSLVTRDGRVVGSRLVGQEFKDPRHFHGRPSATGAMPYDGRASAGSNLGPSNPALADAVKARVEALRALDPGNDAPIPVDLVTASASGLDPDISVAAALWQVPRVARARGMAGDALRAIVMEHVTERQLGILGERRVNVLELNLALDGGDAR